MEIVHRIYGERWRDVKLNPCTYVEAATYRAGVEYVSTPAKVEEGPDRGTAHYIG